MAKDNATVVTYDVDSAVANLKKLDKAVENSEKNAEEAFDGLEDSSSALDTAIGTALGGLASSLSGQILPFLEGLTVAIAENIYGWERASDAINDHIETLERLEKVQGTGTDVLLAQVEAEEQARVLAARQAQVPLQKENASLSIQQATLNQRLSAEKQYYSQLDKIADASVKKRQKLETQLADLLGSIEDRRLKASLSGGTDAFQSNKLVEAADALARSGEFARAESLLDDALSKAGDNRGITNQVEQGYDRLAESIKKATKEAAAQEGADVGRAQSQQQIVAGLQAEVKALKDRQTAVQSQIRESRAEVNDARNDAKEAELAIKLEASQRAVKQQLELVGKQLSENRGQIEKYLDAFKGFFSGDALINNDTIQGQADSINKGIEAADRIAVAFAKAPTTQTAIEQQPNIEKLANFVSLLRANDQVIADSLKPEVDKLETLLEAIRKVSANVAEQQRATNAVQGAQPAAPVAPQRPAGAPAGQPQAAAQQPVNQQVAVSVNVKGGMIDNATIQQISAIVARNIRAGTQQA